MWKCVLGLLARKQHGSGEGMVMNMNKQLTNQRVERDRRVTSCQLPKVAEPTVREETFPCARAVHTTYQSLSFTRFAVVVREFQQGSALISPAALSCAIGVREPSIACAAKSVPKYECYRETHGTSRLSSN